MLLEVSVGEALDKLSILDIKHQRIQDPQRRNAVATEREALASLRPIATEHTLLYSLLLTANERIWDLTDRVKSLHVSDPSYAEIAHQIFEENQARFRIKAILNVRTSSSLHEQKSYAATEIGLVVTTPRIALFAIWALLLRYDRVFLMGEGIDLLESMIRLPMVRIGHRSGAVVDTSVQIDSIERQTPPPLRYSAGGRLGDFVHQLSVVLEMYLRTGSKGALYVGETNVGGDPFSRGLAATIADMSPYLLTLPYIHSVEVYTGQPVDIALSKWRQTPGLFSKSWHQIYGDTYGVPWGAHPWFTAARTPDLADVVLVNTSPMRWTDEVNWSVLLAKYPGTPMFLQTSPSDYQHFCERTGLRLPVVDGSSFSNIVSAVQSCRIFIGTLSMPLAVADALKKDRVAVTQRGGPDEGIAARTDPRYVNRT